MMPPSIARTDCCCQLKRSPRTSPEELKSHRERHNAVETTIFSGWICILPLHYIGHVNHTLENAERTPSDCFSALHPDVHKLVRAGEKRQAAGGGVVGAAATNTAQSTTLVWVTSTIAGVVTSVQIPFSQTVVTAATAANSVSAGVIGLPTGTAALATSAGNTGRELSLVITSTALLLALSFGIGLAI